MILCGLYRLYYNGWISHRRLAWQMAPLPLKQVQAFTNSLWLETQRGLDMTEPRGIVLPLYDDIALLGFSLLLELRHLQVTLPVEIPHCGDLSMTFQRKMHRQDKNVRFIDVCQLAVNAVSDTRPLFCVDLAHCHDKFRRFEIKVLALVYSRFQEIMLLDADTVFFQNPMSLWKTNQYKNTGTLFFNDRISYDVSYLAKRMESDDKRQVDTNVGALHQFLSNFDVTPYRQFGIINDGHLRWSQVPTRHLGLEFSFQPSTFLLNSHVWRLRSGHQMDSSLVLWNKARQPRATAILASFVSLNGLLPPPSYGDKELYWLACELAETAYSFSDFGVGAIGWDLVTVGHQNDGVLCGDALHYYPVQLDSTKGSKQDVPPLYMNSDHILEWGRDSRHLYRTVARPAELYPGSFTERKLPQSCPFNVTTIELAPLELIALKQRQQFYNVVAEWNGWHLFA
ncbi:unnamed protein product [Peronospora belbahrii]|uniref:Nucleotide-diphospho-sugar transferase domain-containing protein n=1 Tax=Peronospora belbahrii TaxID=622444 RepID=A0AAU9LAD4_9STRA|nr:unnamed protein product [Peronospora belbahrii]CAH0521922.1 unnamed protein product [Peronospora belbahrii]